MIDLFAATLILGLALLLIVIVRRVRFWTQGRAAKTDWLKGLLSLPKRYLVDLHAVVARKPSVGRMHMAAAGGFVATAALLPAIVFLKDANPVVIWMERLFALLALCGALVDLHRRGKTPPKHLSKGTWSHFPLWIAVFSIGVILGTAIGHPLGLPEIVETFVVPGLAGAFCLGGVIALLAPCLHNGPMTHALAGAAHLVFHPRPQRFSSDRPVSDLAPSDLTAPKLGVETPTDFAWNRLLGFDACVQCGRCEKACPAFASGQPLNPKKFIFDLTVGMSSRYSDHAYRGSPHPGRAIGEAVGAPDSAIVPNLIHPDTLWACTTCRACVEECPMFIEHVDAIIELRRFQTMELGTLPAKSAEAIENLRLTDNTYGHSPASRMDWAADLGLPLLSDVSHCDVLLWCSDAAFDMRNQRTLRSLVTLLRAADVDVAILGQEEADSGDLALRLGDDATFQSLARRNIDTLSRYKFNLIVTPDPHAYHTLRNEYPLFGGHFNVAHHTSYLSDLVRQGRLQLSQSKDKKVTYHDPCYLARYNGEIHAPRALLSQVGIHVREMERSGFRSRCCGGGGGAALSDVPGATRIPDMRMDDVRETRSETVVVACPNCMTMFEGIAMPRPDVMDIAELLVEQVKTEAER